MPYKIHNQRIRTKEIYFVENEEWKGNEKGNFLPLKSYKSVFHSIRDEEQDKNIIAPGTILQAYDIYCLSNSIDVVGNLNDKYNFSISPYGYERFDGYVQSCIEIEFPNEKGEMEFQSASSLFSDLGSMPYQSCYRELEWLYKNYKHEDFEYFLRRCKLYKNPISQCEPGILAKFIYYVIQYVYYDMMEENVLPENVDEFIEKMAEVPYKKLWEDKKSWEEYIKQYPYKISRGDYKEDITGGFISKFNNILSDMLINCPIVRERIPECVQ